MNTPTTRRVSGGSTSGIPTCPRAKVVPLTSTKSYVGYTAASSSTAHPASMYFPFPSYAQPWNVASSAGSSIANPTTMFTRTSTSLADSDWFAVARHLTVRDQHHDALLLPTHQTGMHKRDVRPVGNRRLARGGRHHLTAVP